MVLGVESNGLRWVGEKVQSAVNNIRSGGMGFGLQTVPVTGDQGGSGSDMDTSSDSEDEGFGKQESVAWCPSDDKTTNPLGSKGMTPKQRQSNHGCDQVHTDSNLSRETAQLKQEHRVERKDGNCIRSRVKYPDSTEDILSDSTISTGLPFRQIKSNNHGIQKGLYTSNCYSAGVCLQANMETTSQHKQMVQDCLAGVQLKKKKKISNNNASAPPLFGSTFEMDHVVEPSSPRRVHDTTHPSNWSVPTNTDCLRKTESVYSGSSAQHAYGNGVSNSPLRTSAGVQVRCPVSSPARRPVFHASGQGTWCALVAYDACVRLCLHAWAQCNCSEVQCFLENECALLRDAFDLQNVLLQSEEELLGERPSRQPSALAAPKPVKTSGKIKLQVRKVKMSVDEPSSGCCFPSPKCSFPSPKIPRINYGSFHRRFSNLRSNLSSGLKCTWNDYLPPGEHENSSFSRTTLACVQAGAKRIKQGSAFLKTRTNTLCYCSSSYEILPETYSCFVRMTRLPEEDAIQMQPGSGETHVWFPDSRGDDLIIQVQNSKGEHCGHALVQVAAIADEPGNKILWWPIYRDLEDEPAGRIQLSLEYSTCPDENNHIKYGSIAETVAYDYVLEVAMKVQHFQQRNLFLHGPWSWLLTEFGSYYGVSDVYTNLRYLSYVMDVATPTEDCLALVHDLLSDVYMKSKSANLLSRQENHILAKIEDQVKKTLALVFENYKSLEESSLSGMVDGFRPASGSAAPALAPAIQLYTLLHDILSPEAQLKLCKYFQVAAKKRLRMNFADTDDLVQTSNEGKQRDLSTSYQRMKSLILSIKHEILTDVQIHNQNILLSSIDLPNISSSIYSIDLCKRLRNFLSACPPPSLLPPVAELIIATSDFEGDLSSWNINPVEGGVDAKDLFNWYIQIWIQEKRLSLLDHCKLDKFRVKWFGASTEHGTTPFVDDVHSQLKEMLDEFEIVISRWPEYTLALETVIADVEKAMVEALDKQYAHVLLPLKDNLINKILGIKYVHKISRHPVNTYSVPKELGILLNSMKRMLDVLWPKLETQLKSWSSCMPDGNATGEHLSDAAALLRTKFRACRLAIAEKLFENTRFHNKTKLKTIIRGSKEVESVIRSRMQPLEVLLRKTIGDLHNVVDPGVFVELCREFWDRMGKDVLHLLDGRRKSYKGLRVAVSNLNDIFASEMQRLRGNSLKETDLMLPEYMEKVHSMCCKDVVYT